MPLDADEYGDDRELRQGVKGVYSREIFMASSRYLFCEVLDHKKDANFIKCRTPGGRVFLAKPMLGTWGEIRYWDQGALYFSRSDTYPQRPLRVRLDRIELEELGLLFDINLAEHLILVSMANEPKEYSITREFAVQLATMYPHSLHWYGEHVNLATLTDRLSSLEE